MTPFDCTPCSPSPQGVQDSSVGEDADQSVLHRDVVEEGLLGVHDEGVGHPQQLDQTAVQTQALVALEHQALIRPALAQEDGGRVVLYRQSKGFWCVFVL